MPNGARRLKGGCVAIFAGVLVFSASAWAQRGTVALDLRGLDAAAYQRLDAVQLESRAVLRLVQEGFAVVSPGSQPELIVRVSLTASALVLQTTAGGYRSVPLGDALRELHFEAAQKIVDLAREGLAGRRDAGQTVDAGAVAVGIPDAGLAPPAAPDVHQKAELAVGAGALFRGGDLDPRVALDVRLPLTPHVGVDLSVALTTSRGVGISILEPELQVGVGYRFTFNPQWSIEPRLLVGALLHVYSVEDPSAVDLAGSRLDFLLMLPVTLVWNPIGNLFVAAHVSPGFSSRTREHLRQGKSLWRREALRLGFGGSVGWRF